MVFVAILNGLVRDELLTPSMGGSWALAVSGLTLSCLVLIVAYLLIPFIGIVRAGAYPLIGLLWAMLTLAFEYLFGHYVVGKTWHEIGQIFNLANGDLFIVVVIVTAFSPWLAAKSRGLL